MGAAARKHLKAQKTLSSTGSSESNEENQKINLKICMLGNGGVGKSSLTLQFMYEDFPEEYKPSSCDAYNKEVTIDGQKVTINILDTAGQEEYSNVRDNYLRVNDGFMLVFSLTESESFNAMTDFREQILRIKSNKKREDIPIILVGNKADVEEKRTVEEDDALRLALDWCCKYVETSAKTSLNVENAFYDIVRQVLEIKKKNLQEKLVQKQSTSGSKKAKNKVTNVHSF